MNEKQLFDQLIKIFPIQDDEIFFIESLDETQKNALDPSILTSFRIREILTDTTLNNEQKRNHLEAFLINKIKTEGDSPKKNIYKLALKLSLHSRGYFTDDLGRLEKQLLMLPCQDLFNPDSQFSNDPVSIHLLWQHINAIRIEFSNCFGKPESYCSKLEQLAKLIRAILYKYQHLNPEPDTEKVQLSIQEKNKQFLLTFIDNASNLINDAMVQTNEDEWSLWTSAALESLDYHKDLKSQSEPDKTEQAVHGDRSNYFLNFSKAFNDPICVHVENQLLKHSSTDLSDSSDSSDNSESSPDLYAMIEAIKNKDTSVEKTEKLRVIEKFFLEACQLLSAGEKQTDFVSRAIQCAIILENNGCSLGTFVRTTACILAEPLSLKQWRGHFETLQCIAIPKRWRSQISDIWFVLAEFFSKNYSEACVFYKDATIACKKQIKLLEPKITSDNNDTPRYSKHEQYILCRYLIQLTDDGFNQKDKPVLDQFIAEFLESKNPHCIAQIVRMLCADSDLREPASNAIQKKYSHDFTNPRIFCEQVLQKTDFNKYLIIWSPLICSTALNKRYLPVINFAQESDTSDAMQFKHCTQIRQQLRHVLFDQLQSTIVVPCGFSYLRVLENKLFDLTSRLMSDHTRNSLYDALCFTHNRQGLREAIVALLFFYDGNYHAAQQMAMLSLKAHSNTHTELQPPNKTITSSLLSVIGTPISGSPELPRKLSPRLLAVSPVKTPPPDSPDGSPRPNEFHTQPLSSQVLSVPSSAKKIPSLKMLRDSDSGTPSSNGRSASPLFQLSPTRSPSGTMDIPFSNSKSPRSRSFILAKTGSATLLTSSVDKKNPTPLGHLIKAMIIWETRLKNNNMRSSTDVTSFQTELTETQDFSIPEEERNFITGMRWLYYLMSYNHSTQQRDKLWLLEGDESLYKKTIADVRADTKRMAQFKKNSESSLPKYTTSKIDDVREDKKRVTELNKKIEIILHEYTTFKIARHYLYNKQSRHNPNTKKFPPAILIIFQFLKSYIEKYPPTEPHLIGKDFEELARLLKDSVYIEGYFPAIPAYLSCYSLAHPPTSEDSELITTGLTPLDRITLIKNALIYSEFCAPFPPNTTLIISEQLKTIEATEQQKLVATRLYPLETSKAFDHQFDCLPIKINFGESIISIDLKTHNECYVWRCKFLNEDEGSFVNDLESLQQQFQRVARIYSYCKKVDLPHNQIIFRQDNLLVITHADIAIIGLIFLAEGKLSIKLTPSEIAPLVELLNEAKSLKETTWQWEGTYARLQNFVPRFQVSNSDDSAKALDADELRNKLRPLSPSQEQIGSPRGHLSPPPSKQRSSLMLASPRRGSTADLLAHSLPSSPRGQANTPSKRDSGKVSIPDGSSGSISGNRSRAATDAAQFRKK